MGDDNFQRNLLEKARGYYEASHQGKSRDAGPHSSAIMAWASSRSWPGRTGSTDRAVFIAICKRMRMDGGMPFRATVREVAELAGVDKMTVNRSMKRLQSAGHIRAETKMGLNAVSLLLPDDFRQQRTNELPTVGSAYTLVGTNVCTKFANHDAWHALALGKSALACWSVLMGSPAVAGRPAERPHPPDCRAVPDAS